MYLYSYVIYINIQYICICGPHNNPQSLFFHMHQQKTQKGSGADVCHRNSTKKFAAMHPEPQSVCAAAISSMVARAGIDVAERAACACSCSAAVR